MIRILFYALLALCVYLARWGATPKRERKPVLDLRHRWIGAEIDHHLRALPGEPGYPEEEPLFMGGAEAPRRCDCHGVTWCPARRPAA